jgi:hypothetical protein
VGEEERRTQELRKVPCDATARRVSTSLFQLEGEKRYIASEVKYLGMVLAANRAATEALRGRLRAAMARMMEMVDTGVLA